MSDVQQTMIDQIGRTNILAVSGGRVRLIGEHGIELPVSNGYRVVARYVPGEDLYTVTREFERGDRRWVHGTRTGVYGDQLGDAVWDAHAFRSKTFGDATKRELSAPHTIPNGPPTPTRSPQISTWH